MIITLICKFSIIRICSAYSVQSLEFSLYLDSNVRSTLNAKRSTLTLNLEPHELKPQIATTPARRRKHRFQRYISLFISNWYWFAIALFLSLSIAYGINRWSEEVYTVSSTLLIKDDQSGALTDISQVQPDSKSAKR